MPPTIPRRLIGYGAYNLCFDTLLGRRTNDPREPNLFQRMRAEGWPVNLVKVIVFRNAGIEGLTPQAFPGRRVTLYDSNREINEAFLVNLAALVDAAAAVSPKFYVQVCIHHYHAVKYLEEQPENAPLVLQPNFGDFLVHRLRKFFSPSLDARSHAQKQLVAALGQTLKGKTNVLWELANEVRIDGHHEAGEDAEAHNDNSNLVGWLSQMRQALIDNTGPDIHVTTSTGYYMQQNTGEILNEQVTMRHLPVTFFDFHSGQWDFPFEGNPPRQVEDYQFGIRTSKERAAAYNPNAFLIINDDGLHDDHRTAPNIGQWSLAAFQRGLHYSTKSPYPPAKDLSSQVLQALKTSNNSVP